MGRRPITSIEQRLWYRTKLGWEGEHFVWKPEDDEVDEWNGPKVYHGNKTVNARRLVFESKIRKLETWERLRVSCGVPKCMMPSHMEVTTASHAGKVKWARQRKSNGDKPWALPGVDMVHKGSQLSEQGVAIFRLMKMIILDLFDSWNPDEGLVDTEWMEKNKDGENPGLILNTENWAWGKARNDLQVLWDYRTPETDECFLGVLREPLMWRELAKAGSDFDPTTLPQQMRDRIGAAQLYIYDDDVNHVWAVDMDKMMEEMGFEEPVEEPEL